jgi:hypothetical protein
MESHIDSFESFDAEKVVADYRRVVGEFEAEPTAIGKAEFRGIATRMRASWKVWQGEDSLHEMAFGEPES